MAKISSRQRAKCVRIHNRVLKKGYYARMFDPADYGPDATSILGNL